MPAPFTTPDHLPVREAGILSSQATEWPDWDDAEAADWDPAEPADWEPAEPAEWDAAELAEWDPAELAKWDPAELAEWDPAELARWDFEDLEAAPLEPAMPGPEAVGAEEAIAPDAERGGPGWAGGTGPQALRAGPQTQTRGDGGWFASGGIADDLVPGPRLAGFIADAGAIGLGRLTDDELVGVLRAARRMASWSAAMELAAARDLWRRRWAEEQAGATGAACHADDEIAAALTLTRRAADQVLSLAVALRRLPLTSQALTAGAIDLPRAMVIADEVTGLSNEHAAAVEQAVIGAAAAQTTGQLRAATRRAVMSADPRAARKRKERALQDARVERWDEHGGTAALAGRDLPPASVLAADKNLSALARQLKRAGAPGTLDQLRAQVYLALLTGTSAGSLIPAGPGTSPDASSRSYPGLAGDSPAGTTPPGFGSHAGPSAFGGLGVPAGSGISGGPGISAGPGSSGLGISASPGSASPGSASPGSASPGSASSGPSASPGLSAGPAISTGPVTSSPPVSADIPGRAGIAGIPGGFFAGGAVNLTMPLASWLGLSDAPGDVAGYGPMDADESRVIADALSARAGTKWCLTLTDAHGRPVAHGCARAGPPPGQHRAERPTGQPGGNRPGSRAGPASGSHDGPAGGSQGGPAGGSRDGPASGSRDGPAGGARDGPAGGANDGPAGGAPGTPQSPPPGTPQPCAPDRTWTFSLTLLAGSGCDHARETAAYRPSPGLRHLVEIRHVTCTYPGCRRPAMHCDADHTLAYHRGGRTCLCNLAPLCRRHHQAKQARGWHLEQAQHGNMTWTTPSGRSYATRAETYPL